MGPSNSISSAIDTNRFCAFRQTSVLAFMFACCVFITNTETPRSRANLKILIGPELLGIDRRVYGNWDFITIVASTRCWSLFRNIWIPNQELISISFRSILILFSIFGHVFQVVSFRPEFCVPIVFPACLIFFGFIIWPLFGEHTNRKDSLHAVIFWIFSPAHRFRHCNSMRIGPLMWETKFHTHVHVSFKMFPESLYFWEEQNITIIYATFPSKLSPCATIHFCQRLWKCWKHSCKSFCESLFSFSVAFLIMSLASQKYRPFNSGFSQENR